MIKVFTGPMYASKSYGLINTYLKLINEEKDNIVCFKPSKDTRDKAKIKSRVIKTTLDAIVIKDFSEIKWHINEKTKVILIDEAQFISGDTQELLWLTIYNKIDIYIAGLNLTSELTPFNSMPNILSIATDVVNLYADCEDCGKDAEYTYCLVNKKDEILVGSDEYIPLCRDCLYKRLKSKEK